MTTLTLPTLPPPLSACFTNVRRNGRAATPRYTKWVIEALHAVQEQRVYGVNGIVSVVYQFRRPDRRPRDLGNLEKAVSDLLVKAGLIEDDSLIIDLRMLWGGDAPVTITITPA
jgi:crossover junction endodeoxyribonuclease RusA